MLIEFLPPYSPFLNPIEEFFSAWRWKVYDRQPHTQMTLLAAMDAAWIRHSKRDSFHVALEGKISGVMWMRICGPTDRNVWMCRDSTTVLQAKLCFLLI